MEELISVIIPIYNTKNYLNKCIDSILKQSYTNLQVILVDDGSTDGSDTICDNYTTVDSRVTVVHKENGGLSSARNAGLDIAKGVFIGFVDSDDTIHEDMYKTMHAIIKQYKATIIGIKGLPVYSDTVIDKSIPSVPLITTQSYDMFIKGLLNRKADCSVCSKLFLASVFESHRFNEKRLNEDGLLLFELFLNGKYKYVSADMFMYYYLQRDGSICHQGFNTAIVSMMDNYLFMEEKLRNQDVNYTKESNDAVVFACRTYALTVPYDFYKQKSDRTKQIVSEIKKRRSTILKSNLSLRDRIAALAFSLFPDFVEFIIMLYKRKKKSNETYTDSVCLEK